MIKWMILVTLLAFVFPAYAQFDGPQSNPENGLPSVPSLEEQEAEAPEQPNVTIDPVDADPNDPTILTGPCAEFSVKLYNCQKYSCSKPHAEIDGYSTKHIIMGLSPDGRLCRHVQSLPDGNVVDCKYTTAMRDLVVRMTAEGANALTEGEQLFVSNIFRDQCEVKSESEL